MMLIDICCQNYDWQLFHDFQTLIAGSMALGAAGVTIYFLNRQINQSAKQETKRRERKAYASRSVLPSALLSICRYEEQWVKLISEIQKSGNHEIPKFGNKSENSEIDSIYLTDINLTEILQSQLPSEYLNIIKDCIEYGDKSLKDTMSGLIGLQQKQTIDLDSLFRYPDKLERLKDFDEMTNNLLADAIQLHARAMNLFEYSLFKVKDIPPFKEKTKEALELLRESMKIVKFHTKTHPEVVKILEDQFGILIDTKQS